MMGQPWISIFVGAVMPRQKTAFALEEVKMVVAATDIRAAHSNNNSRIVSSPALVIALAFCSARNIHARGARRGTEQRTCPGAIDFGET